MQSLQITKPIVVSLAILSLSGCVAYNEFDMGMSSAQIKEVQILDPDASIRNDGRLNALDGQYGEQVMKAYRTSKTAPKEARSRISEANVN